MGAEMYIQEESGETAKEAFNNAVEDACYWFGHGGYTGTIAEKTEFVMIPLPQGQDDIAKFIDDLLERDDERVSDKWGPARLIKKKESI